MCFRKLFNLDKVEALSQALTELQEKYNNECTVSESEINSKDNQISDLQVGITALNAQIVALQQQVTSLQDTDTDLEKFCKDLYVQREIAYTNKRYIDGKPITEFLRNFITPEACMVVKERKVIPKNNNKVLWYSNVGNHIAQVITWTSDQSISGKLDYYFYPWETLITKIDDCEGHAYLVSSLEPEIAVAYGFRLIGDDWCGHAFNLFIADNELYILDTVSNNAEIYKFSEVKDIDYKLNYIITKNFCFIVDRSVIFGIEEVI